MVVRLSSLEPAHQALLLPQSGPQAIPTDRSTSHHFAAARGHANRSSHTPPFLPLGPGMCGQDGHGCRMRLNPLRRPRPRLHAQWPVFTTSEAGTGRASPARRFATRRWELSPSGGCHICHAHRRQASRRQTADASTSWCTDGGLLRMHRGLFKIAQAPISVRVRTLQEIL